MWTKIGLVLFDFVEYPPVVSHLTMEEVADNGTDCDYSSEHRDFLEARLNDRSYHVSSDKELESQ